MRNSEQARNTDGFIPAGFGSAAGGLLSKIVILEGEFNCGVQSQGLGRKLRRMEGSG